VIKSDKMDKKKIGLSLKIAEFLKQRRFRSGLVLDLGCGIYKRPGAIGIDLYSLPGVDLIWDLTKFPYPFPSSSAKKIYLVQVLEHFKFPQQLKILKEAARILKAGGILELQVPHTYSIGSFQDPTHQAFFTFHTIDYLTSGSSGYEWYPKNKLPLVLQKRDIKVLLSYSRHMKSAVWAGLERIPTLFMKFILRVSPGLADIFLRLLPFFYVDVIWILKKKRTV